MKAFQNHLPIGYIYMYGIFTYIYLHLVDFMVNVGKYTIHGSYWLCLASTFSSGFFTTFCVLRSKLRFFLDLGESNQASELSEIQFNKKNNGFLLVVSNVFYFHPDPWGG